MLRVYHGSTVAIEEPLVNVGRDNLDFGKGFYVTDLKAQAINWAQRMAGRLLATPTLNTYEFDIEKVKLKYKCLCFPQYNIDWLDFIAANRKGKELWRKYDLIEGGIANDRVADTVEAYIAGMMSAEIALERLSQHKPNNQICILRQPIIDNYLKFISSETL